MQPKNCSKCGELMKGIPAGVSKKTGKPYGAFYKCNVCGASESGGQATPRTSPPAQGGFTDTDRKVLYAAYKLLEKLTSEPAKSVLPPETVNNEIKPEDIPF